MVLPAHRVPVAVLALLAILLLAAAPAAEAAGGSPGWRWPLDPRPRVAAGFDAPAGLYAAGHRGVDLEAAAGQPVRSAGAGVVSFAGSVAGRGVVTVAHPDGRRTTYEPVSATVSAGDSVAAGEVLGRVSAGPGHCLPGTCLHWGLRDGDSYQDPLGLLGASRVRLLPVWGHPVPSGAPPAAWSPAVVSRPARGPLMAGLAR